MTSDSCELCLLFGIAHEPMHFPPTLYLFFGKGCQRNWRLPVQSVRCFWDVIWNWMAGVFSQSRDVWILFYSVKTQVIWIQSRVMNPTSCISKTPWSHARTTALPTNVWVLESVVFGCVFALPVLALLWSLAMAAVAIPEGMELPEILGGWALFETLGLWGLGLCTYAFLFLVLIRPLQNDSIPRMHLGVIYWNLQSGNSPQMYIESFYNRCRYKVQKRCFDIVRVG